MVLARHGVELEIRHSAGAVEDLNLLRDPTSGVQAAFTTFGFTLPSDVDILSIRWVGYSTQRYSFHVGPKSLLPRLRNPEISALRWAHRQPLFGHLC
jgi:hypothetical protein